MPKCPMPDTHPCPKPENIHNVISKTGTEKDEADLLFHYIFHSKCDICTAHVLKGIELFREKIFQTLQGIPYADQREIAETNEAHIRKLCGQIGVAYPSQNF